MFQTETMICANSPINVEDFIDYDFVRVPLDLLGGDFGGGISLRNWSVTKKIRKSSWAIEKSANDASGQSFEIADIWLTKKMKHMGARFPKK